ncbi:MAG: hypothetical protein ROY82_06785 [Truepera sp.]|jgi:2-keto-3-deoxy-6-phosphogluconate aldolase|nr:hypothetical protein [Truepera sp.]
MTDATTHHRSSIRAESVVGASDADGVLATSSGFMLARRLSQLTVETALALRAPKLPGAFTLSEGGFGRSAGARRTEVVQLDLNGTGGLKPLKVPFERNPLAEAGQVDAVGEAASLAAIADELSAGSGLVPSSTHCSRGMLEIAKAVEELHRAVDYAPRLTRGTAGVDSSDPSTAPGVTP